MRALLFEGIPLFQECDGAATVSGTGVYWDGVVKALFRHGTYDTYYFLWRSVFSPPPEQQVLTLEGLDPRARTVNICDLERLNVYDDVVLFTATPYICGLIPLRSTPRSSRWVVSGVVHSLDGWDLPHILLSLMHSDVDDADSLLCSTQAGKAVLEKLFIAAAGFQQPPAWRGVISHDLPMLSLPVVPLGIDCQAYCRGGRGEARRSLGISRDTVLIVCIGRMSPISKCDLLPLIHTVARMARTDANIQLIIAGDDTQHHMSGFLESTALLLGCADCIRVRPNIGDGEKMKLLTAADIFVSPSDNTQETFGLSIAEAMAAALPVVASDWNGYKELVTHGVTGFLIPTYWLQFDEALDRLASTSFLLRNSALATSTIVDLEGLEYYLRLLIERPDLRAAMGQAGKRHALERYDWSAVIKRYEAVWDDSFLKSSVLRKDRYSFANCPQHSSYQEIFSHYPSRTLSYNEVVEITAMGQWFHNAGSPAELTISPNGIIDLAHIRRLLQIVEELGPTSISELAGRVTEETRAPWLVTTTSIAFSLKYNFLRLQTTGFSQAGPGAPPEESADSR